MAEIILSDINLSQYKDRLFTLSDPCVGAGALPLAYFRCILRRFGKEDLKKIGFTGIDISHNGIRLCAIQMLSNICIHDMSLGEIALVQGNSLLMDFDAMKVICHATLGSGNDEPTHDPRKVLLANKETIKANAKAHFQNMKENDVSIQEIASGRALFA